MAVDIGERLRNMQSSTMISAERNKAVEHLQACIKPCPLIDLYNSSSRATLALY